MIGYVIVAVSYDDWSSEWNIRIVVTRVRGRRRVQIVIEEAGEIMTGMIKHVPGLFWREPGFYPTADDGYFVLHFRIVWRRRQCAPDRGPDHVSGELFARKSLRAHAEMVRYQHLPSINYLAADDGNH